MKIEVIAIRILNNGRSLRAFADIRVNDWIIHDFRIIQQRGKKALISSPQVSWKDPDTGEIRYKAILTIPPEQRQRIDTEILHAYQGEMEKQKREE